MTEDKTLWNGPKRPALKRGEIMAGLVGLLGLLVLLGIVIGLGLLVVRLWME